MKVLALLLLALSFQHPVMSQNNNSALLARIELSIAKKEPKWKLAHKGATKKGDYVSFAWKARESNVSVFIAFYGTTDKAANGLKNLPGLFEDTGLKMTILPASIPNLGDENYTWEDFYDRRFKGVAFRKDKVVVKVNAPSIEIAQRFASHIAEVITANALVRASYSNPDIKAGSGLQFAKHLVAAKLPR